jgi:DNA-directed RNA polymerase specialized sigma24 family protein
MPRNPKADPSGKDAAGLDVVVALEREWDALASRALDGRLRVWSDREPALTSFSTVQELLHSLRRLRGTHEAENAILVALVRQARSDPLAARVVLQALLPGLKRLAGRLLLDVAERDELWSLLLAHLWEQIRRYPLERRPRRIAANLLLDAAHATLADLGTERRLRAQPSDAVPASPAHAEGGEHEEVVLASAVRAGALSREEALLILRTRIEAVSLARLAADEGVRYDALRMRRRRAERRLLLFLGHLDVRFRGRNRPLSSARVVGHGLTGSAGGGAVTHPKLRR